MHVGSPYPTFEQTGLVLLARASDAILTDVSMSMFRLYDVRDFLGPIGRRGLFGADGPAAAKGDKGDSGDP